MTGLVQRVLGDHLLLCHRVERDGRGLSQEKKRLALTLC